MEAKSLQEWISNFRSLNKLIINELFIYSQDSAESWSFSNDSNPYYGIYNYLNIMWSFMHTHNGVIYDNVDFDTEPGDHASMCGINTCLKAKKEYGSDYIFMVFSRDENAWKIEGFCVRGYNNDLYESKLHLQTCRLVLPWMYKKPIPNEVVFDRIDRIIENHIYNNIHRATLRFRESIHMHTGENEGNASEICTWLICHRLQSIENEKNINGPFEIDPALLKDIWFARGAKNEKCANPRFDLVYPVFDQNRNELDACLCLNRTKNNGNRQIMKAKTLFSPKMAYRDALILSSHTELSFPSSWLRKDCVEKSIENGCEDY